MLYDKTLSGTLSGTMAEEKKTLPRGTEELSQIDLLKTVLSEATTASQANRIGGGIKSVTSGLASKGLDTSRMSGDVITDIIGYVENRVNDPIQKQYNRVMDIVDSIEKRYQDETENARTNLNLLVSTGSLDKVSDEELQVLSNTAGISMESIAALKKTIAVNNKAKSASGGGAIVSDDTDGTEYDLTNINDLKKLKEKGYLYEEVRALMDKHAKIDASTTEYLLQGAGFVKPEDRGNNITVSQMTGVIDNIIKVVKKKKKKKKIDYPSADVFVTQFQKNFSNATPSDIEMAKGLYEREIQRIKELPWLARQMYLKDK